MKSRTNRLQTPAAHDLGKGSETARVEATNATPAETEQSAAKMTTTTQPIPCANTRVPLTRSLGRTNASIPDRSQKTPPKAGPKTTALKS